MTALIYSYTDWQAAFVPQIIAALAAEGHDAQHIGRRTKPIASPSVRSLSGFAPFEPEGNLPVLEDPQDFENLYFRDYAEQMTRYSKGFAKRHHSLERTYEYRDHFHLTARKILAYFDRHQVSSVLFFNVPHMGDDYLVYRVAETLGLSVVMLINSLFRSKFFSATRLENIGLLNPQDKREGHAIAFDALDKELRDSVNVYMGGSYKVRDQRPRLRDGIAPLAIVATRCPRLLLKPAKLKLALEEVRRIRSSLGKFRRARTEIGSGKKAQAYLTWLSGLERDPANLPENFIYFAMHYQPEMTSSPQGGQYMDQALLIEELSAKLPPGMVLVAKENPLQASYNRSPEFIARVTRCANVIMAHPHMDTATLQARAAMVATITGTAGWEAIKAGKPCLTFGYSWYRACPGITQFTPETDLSSAMHDRPSLETTQSFLSQLMARTHDGVIYEAFLKDSSTEYVARNREKLARLCVDLILARAPTTFG